LVSSLSEDSASDEEESDEACGSLSESSMSGTLTGLGVIFGPLPAVEGCVCKSEDEEDERDFLDEEVGEGGEGEEGASESSESSPPKMLSKDICSKNVVV
jgi:hypothetical protein